MSAELEPEEQFGPYLVYERLGVGGMATVHRALEHGLEGFEREVALKRLLPHLADDASFIKAFVREAKLASLLQHENIVQIYELGRVGSEYFISMEHIDGRDIRRILRHARRLTGPPPNHVTVGLLLQLCDALDYAHTRKDADGQPLNLVHRDISPSNVLVTTTGQVKIIDFGIAKAQAIPHQTQTGRIKGKLAYMAPEAISGKDLDARSDLFAVGVIAHELLSARPLFASKNEYETLLKVQRDVIVPPSTYNPSCPPELDDIVLRALSRNRDDRYQCAADLREALRMLERAYKLQTGNRDIAVWLDWAFGLDAPSSGAVAGAIESNNTSLACSTPGQRAPTPLGGTPTPHPRREDDDAVEVAWGSSDGTLEGPIELPDVPDVSHRHHLPRPSGRPQAVIVDDDEHEGSEANAGVDDIPATAPTHVRPSREMAAVVDAWQDEGVDSGRIGRTSVRMAAVVPDVLLLEDGPAPADKTIDVLAAIEGATGGRGDEPSLLPVVRFRPTQPPTMGGSGPTTAPPPARAEEEELVPVQPPPSPTLVARPTGMVRAQGGGIPGIPLPAPPPGALLSMGSPSPAGGGTGSLPTLGEPLRAIRTQPGHAPARANTSDTRSTAEVAALRPRGGSRPPPPVAVAMTLARRGPATWMLVTGGVVVAGAVLGAVRLAGREKEPAAVVPAPSPERGEPATPPLPTEQPTLPRGSVKFDLEPRDATISIDGRLAHDGSPWSVELTPGAYQIQITRAGFKAWLTTLELSANEIHTLRVVLPPITQAAVAEATLILSSTPTGLEAVLDGNVLAQRTPLRMPIAAGAHTIVVRQDGADVWRQELLAQANADYEFSPSMDAAKRRERAQRRGAPRTVVIAPAPAPAGSASPADAGPEITAPPVLVPPPAAGSGAPTAGSAQPALPPPTTPPPTPLRPVTPPVISPPRGPVTVPPSAVTRLSGETPTIPKLEAAAIPAVVAAKLCIDATGTLTSVTLISKIDPRAQRELVAGLRTWRYAPYVRAGTATPACFALSFRLR